ncbi:hypothetical protein Tco_1232183 [Tanacetum coccineum]
MTPTKTRERAMESHNSHIRTYEQQRIKILFVVVVVVVVVMGDRSHHRRKEATEQIRPKAITCYRQNQKQRNTTGVSVSSAAFSFPAAGTKREAGL